MKTPTALSLCAVALWFFASAASAAESCTPLDIRSDVLGPPMDQGQLGWCFAYATSDALSQALGVRLSPTTIGVKASEEHSWIENVVRKLIIGNTWSGQWASTTAESAVDGGLCRLGDENFDPTQLEKEFLHGGHALRHGPGYCEHTLPRYRVTYDLGGPSTVDGSFDDTLPMIDQALESGVLPVIEYEPRHIIKHAIGLHISSVVGRRPAGDHCEYLVRNSWGAKCYQEYLPNIHCEDGNYWISARDLTNMVETVFVIDSLKRR